MDSADLVYQRCAEQMRMEEMNRAWWHYWSGNYKAMAQCLTASPTQQISSQLIAHWIAYFQQSALNRRHFFDVDGFTDLKEWHALLESALGIESGSTSTLDSKNPDCENAEPSFVLYRTLGSDLPPRHYVGQTLANLQFILNHEPPLHHCQKRWVVNRIVDKEQEQKILETLRSHHQTYRHIPFNEDEYAQVSYDFDSFLEPDFLRSPAFAKLDHNSQIWARDRPYRPKNLAAINLNAVRNQILDEGQQLADWTLVLDGGCFITQNAWVQLLKAPSPCKQLVIPMVRLTHNEQLFSTETIPPPTEEPQIALHRSSQVRFDESLQYGRFTKVELFRRLQVPGVWDKWNYKPWEHKQWHISSEAKQWVKLGRVARLASGHRLDHDQGIEGMSGRTTDRQAAVWQFIDAIDERIFRRRFDPDNLLFFSQRTLSRFRYQRQQGNRKSERIAQQLIQFANKALSFPAYSVVQKPKQPPSGDRHDYWSLSAFSWPDPSKPDGLPYIFRDGLRRPETNLFSPESNQYDHTRLQRTLNHVTVLALSWYITEDIRYALHGAKLVRTWFIDPATRMNPHLEYAQVELGKNNNRGMRWGIIDTQDLYYLLDAVRLLKQSGVWSAHDHRAMQDWCRALLHWLINSEQGKAESCAKNNHGTCYDLQKAALSGFCGDAIALYQTLEYSKFRLALQFEPDGQQPQERVRSDTLHYFTFNLQSWANLAKVAERAGIDLWHYQTKTGQSLERAFAWLLPYYHQPWPHKQAQKFNYKRLRVLYAIAADIYPAIRENPTLKTIPPASKILTHPYSGSAPGWMFALNLEGSNLEDSSFSERNSFSERK